jgi:glycosyltransferase involved in cell wall biosynthesis
MNILFVDQFSQSGGAQLCLMDLLPAVVERRWNARLLVPGDGELAAWCRRVGIPVHGMKPTRYANGSKSTLDLARFAVDIPRTRRAIRAIVAQYKIDLVYVNGPRVLAAAIRVGCPVVFQAHSVVAGRYSQKVIELSARWAGAKVIAVSEFVAQHFPGCRMAYNGVPDFGGDARHFGVRPARVGIVGRIAPEKGHLDFVDAARMVAQQSRDARFLVYGERLFSDAGYDRKVRAAAQDLPVEFCGWNRDAGAVMRDLDILVVPSGPKEAATRVIMEAFSAGTPVVAYRSGGIPELIDHGRTGLLVERRDIDGLSRAIVTLLADTDRMIKLSAAGRSQWGSRFRIEMFRESACEVIDSVYRGKSQAASTVAGEEDLVGSIAPRRR